MLWVSKGVLVPFPRMLLSHCESCHTDDFDNMSAGNAETRRLSDTANTNQHYVPQMLLRGFSTVPGGEQVWVFDKRTQRAFPTAIRNIAAERGYYDLDGSAVLDAAMNEADDLAASIINRIRTRHSLAGITVDEKGMLAGVTVMQMLRTRAYQERVRHMTELLAAKVTEMAGAPPPDLEMALAEDRLREDYLRMIPKFTAEFMPHLVDKDLFLFETDRNVPFRISDNPIALQNTMNPGDGIMGNLGLAVTGIEIYLPISCELTLAFICRSLGQHNETVRDMLWNMGGFISEKAYRFLQSRDMGKAMLMKPEHVRFQNSLQARIAERFVISSVNQFADVANMLERNPNAQFGPRAITWP
jgi:Protein of unknown function (DUF4238)